MGFSLKKTLKKAESFGKSGLNSVFGGMFGDPGQANPFAPPDINSIYNPAAFDFLKSWSPSYDSMDASEGAFGDLLKAIEGTNESGMNYLDSLGKGIDTNTAKAVANVRLNALDRGIGGAGLWSDIEGADIGTAEALGAQSKNDLLSNFMLQQANATQGAYGQRYSDLFGLDTNRETNRLNTQASRDNALASILANIQTGKATNLVDLYKTGEKNKIDTAKNPIWEDILRNTKVSLSPAA
jgi:hypothetical protein